MIALLSCVIYKLLSFEAFFLVEGRELYAVGQGVPIFP
jgi:hypothetical protein